MQIDNLAEIIFFLVSLYLLGLIKLSYSINYNSYNPIRNFNALNNQLVDNLLSFLIKRGQKKISVPVFLFSTILISNTLFGISSLFKLGQGVKLESLDIVLFLVISNMSFDLIKTSEKTSLNVLKRFGQSSLRLAKIVVLIFCCDYLAITDYPTQVTLNLMLYFYSLWISYESLNKFNRTEHSLVSNIYLINSSVFVFIAFFQDHSFLIKQNYQLTMLFILCFFSFFYFLLSRRRSRIFLERFEIVENFENRIFLSLLLLRVLFWIL